ncbi:MAG: squalene/phytoene synthase family protein, partial [Opitutales bacterium]
MAEFISSDSPAPPPSAAPEAVAARNQSNLAFALRGLSPERRAAMCVFYDFCRRVDDIADDPALPAAEKCAQLEAWRRALRACYEGGDPGPAAELCPVFQTYNVPLEEPMAIVDGVAMDISERRFETIDDLLHYCWHVASAVGLVSIRIFGCDVTATREFAITLGYALQLTNILRDVVDDYRTMGRVYLQQAELRAFGVEEAALADPRQHVGAQALFRMCHYRCEHFFAKARRLMPTGERRNLGSALVMAAFYQDILRVIRRRDFRLGPGRIKLGKARKIQLMLATWREKDRPVQPLAPPRRVAVWGAGAAGLAAALEAGRRGHTPVLLEGKGHLGGRAHSYRDARTGRTVDNGQHILMGCYKAFLRLIDLLGTGDQLHVAPRLAVPYRTQRGDSRLAAVDLPAPWHLLGALFNFRELSWNDRFAILSFGAALRLGNRPSPGTTADAWLDRLGQTSGAKRALWEPFCVAALNEPLDTADAGLLHETLRRSLFGAKDAAAVIMAKGGFSELFHPRAGQYLAAIGGKLRMGVRLESVESFPNPESEHSASGNLALPDSGASRVASGEFDSQKPLVAAVHSAKGERIEADVHIAALPWTRLVRLLPEGELRGRLERLPAASIISAHVRVRPALSEGPVGFVGLLDSPVHWVFTKEREHDGSAWYALVISAAGQHEATSNAALRERISAELQRNFPEAGTIEVLDCEVHRWREATFAATPESEP